MSKKKFQTTMLKSSGRQKEILPQVTSPEISSYISAVVLSKIVEKDASLLDTS